MSFDVDETVSVQVQVEWAPAYELVVSLEAFVSRREQKTMDLGTAWCKEVRQTLSADLLEQIESLNPYGDTPAFGLLIHACPGERDVAGFLRWLREVSAGELYEILAPQVVTGPLPPDIRSSVEWVACGLERWNEEYFRHVDRAIFSGLREDACAKQKLIGTMSPTELGELATNGMVLRADGPDMTLLLVPQYHFKPWNLYAFHRSIKLIEYPADALQPAPGEPPTRLMRLTRALSDESRLRILHFLAESPRTFGEIVRFSGLAKSTVHHHMVVLRAAGLVRVYDAGENPSYTLRPGAADTLADRLRAYLTTQ